jgi:MFS family permease
VLGIGGGITFNPILLAAMSGVEPNEAGLASGVVNTSFMMGGALGLAILASVAASRTDSLRTSGHGPLDALNGGYHLAFMIGAVFAVLAGAVAAAFIHAEAPAGAHGGEPVPAVEAE